MASHEPLLPGAHTFRQVVAYGEDIAADPVSHPSLGVSFVVLRLWIVEAMEVAHLTFLAGDSVLGERPARQLRWNCRNLFE